MGPAPSPDSLLAFSLLPGNSSTQKLWCHPRQLPRPHYFHQIHCSVVSILSPKWPSSHSLFPSPHPRPTPPVQGSGMDFVDGHTGFSQASCFYACSSHPPLRFFYNHSRSFKNTNLIMLPDACLEPLRIKIKNVSKPRRPCVITLTPLTSSCPCSCPSLSA